MTKPNRKQARQEAIAAELRKREAALNVPRDKQVYVLSPHYADQGGPRGFTCPEIGEYPNEEWSQRLRSAPDSWTPAEIVPEDDEELDPNLPVGDFDHIITAHMMVFSRRAADALAPLLFQSGVVFPLRCTAGDYVGFRLDANVDALDLDRSSISWIVRPNAISSIYRYAFETEKLGPPVFRIPQHYERLVLQPFVDVVRANNFSGFRFCRVWPSAAALWHYGDWC